MTDVSPLDAGAYMAPETTSSAAPVDLVASAGTAGSSTPAAVDTSATVVGASVPSPNYQAPAGTVTLSAEQFAELLAAAKAAAPGLPATVTVPARPRITPAEALKAGDVVSHTGRPALILEVLESTRAERGGPRYTQVSYRVGVFAEDRTLDAEDFGSL